MFKIELRMLFLVGGSVLSFCNGGGFDVILVCRILKLLKNKCRKYVRYFGL